MQEKAEKCKRNFTILNQLKMLKQAKKGDVIWAKMPLRKSELKTIPENHQIRPYVIMHKGLFGIEAYPSSSSAYQNAENFSEYRVLSDSYNDEKFDRDCYFDLRKTYKIPFYKFVNSFYTLNSKDKQGLNKKLGIIKNRKIEVKYMFDETYSTCPGDVVFWNGLTRYIYSEDDKVFRAYNIYKNFKDREVFIIKIGRQDYGIDTSQKIEIPKNSNLQLVNVATVVEMIDIENVIKNYNRRKRIGERCQKRHEANLQKKEEKQKARDIPVKSRDESRLKPGRIFKVGNSKICYLFEFKGVQYGADILMCKVSPKLVQIGNIFKFRLIEEYSNEKTLALVDYLLDKEVAPKKKLLKLREELTEI